MKKSILIIILLFSVSIGIYSQNINTELYKAVKNNNTDSVELLLQQGADANTVTDNCQTTLLHLAYLNENYEIAKLLIDSGADVNARDCGGRKPVFR